MLPRLSALIVGTLLLLGTLVGCSATVSLQPAPYANDPLCAEVSVRLPDRLSGQERHWTNAQATGAWGDPTSIIVACGVEPPGATTLPCRELEGIDWIVDDSDAPNWRFTTFGRTPAVEVYLDSDVASSGDALRALANGIAQIPAERTCTERPAG